MNNINKKILNITIILVLCFTGFSHALEKSVKNYSNIEATKIFIGELDNKLNEFEKKQIYKYVKNWKYIFDNRISKKNAKPSDKEIESMKKIIKKLDEYTIKYYFDNKYEAITVKPNYTNYVIENIKSKITPADYKKLYILCEKNERDKNISDDQVQEIVDEVEYILNKYTGLNSKQLLDYLLIGSENLLAMYRINEDNIEYKEIPNVTLSEKDFRIKQIYPKIWDDIVSIIPYEYFSEFDNFIITSDGELNNLGYVIANDSIGKRWSISIDPSDVANKELFYETVIHEYFHYVTLNENQVLYSQEPNIYTYYDYELVTNVDSYLNLFSNRFWSILIFENQNTVDNYLFYLRHQSDFANSYAATNPAEDICETFISFVINDKPKDNSILSQKIKFLYKYPELVDLRKIIKNNINIH